MIGVIQYKLQKYRWLTIFLHNVEIIPSIDHENLRKFRYQGGTDSLSYQYLWSPLAEYLLRYFPEWVAPNVITMTGLILLSIQHVIFMLPDQGDVVPGWKLMMMAGVIIIYQHLDNIDGKQARRTKSSSPLGMLFDHGSDALSAFIISGQVLKMGGVSASLSICAIYVFVMSNYFCAMWSQYAVGYFRLGRINPVDEGLPAYALLCLLTMMIDQTQLRNYHYFGTYSEEFVFSLVVLLIPSIYNLTKDVFVKPVRSKLDIFNAFLLYPIPGILLFLIHTSNPQILDIAYYEIFYATMFMWARNMILIQLQYLTKQKFVVLNRGTLTYIFFMLGCLLIQFIPISTRLYFLLFTIVQALVFLEFVVSVLSEGSRILDIQVFSLEKRK